MELNTNDQYLHKIKEKNYQIQFQKLLLDSSFEFMNIDQENFDNKVNILLENLGSFFNVDRAYLFTLNHRNYTMTYSHEWCNRGVEPEIHKIEEMPINRFPWWLDQLNKNNIIYIEDVGLMPSEAEAEKEQLNRQNVKSIASVAVIVEDKIKAFIGIDSVKASKKWTKRNMDLLHIIAKILSSGMVHVNYHKSIDFMAYHDLLTGLPNRLLLSERVNEGILSSRITKNRLSIMLINLDGFKMINDSLGYDQGDSLLKEVAKRLVKTVRKKDTVCRIGGDEFVLYINDYKDEAELDLIACKIIKALNKPFILRGEEYFITASMGISQHPIDGQDVETLIKNADMAMYKAKNLGRNQYYKCTSALKNSTLETIALTNDLYRAIEKDELMLYYQPKVDGLSGEILGVEALLRWDHPEYGFVPPFKFIPLAEKTQLILPIGNWVLNTACKQLKSWQEKGLRPIKLAVNFSVYQLNNPSIVKQIQDILERHSLDPKYLEIEITESAAIDTSDKIKETLEKINDLGVSLSIDDFGKEYSSLNRLKELPIDTVKIDMSFVQGIGACHKDEIIIRYIISLAADFGYKTIAEGVETREQIDFLNYHKCDQLQGYYFHKPMPAAELEKLLDKESNMLNNKVDFSSD